ncbi:MAG TPA: site-2 protease family protein [Anaeromyxobacteraceae bacterium]|nr:site-2 protease family protein [Anaeromyxobacteraceae bacterium]
MDLTLQGILQRLLLYLPVLLLSLTVHEYAHAWTARKLGDDTAERIGRLTLNPLAHADPIGTFLLPVLGVPFGWARPVPVNPARFRRDVRMTTGMMITSLAGPFANFALAVLATVAMGLLYRLAPAAADAYHGIAAFLAIAIQMNVALGVFNMLPLPPLDGSRIVDALLPARLRPQWEAFSRVAPFLLLVIVFWGWRIIAVPIAAGINVLERLLHAIV